MGNIEMVGVGGSCPSKLESIGFAWGHKNKAPNVEKTSEQNTFH